MANNNERNQRQTERPDAPKIFVHRNGQYQPCCLCLETRLTRCFMCMARVPLACHCKEKIRAHRARGAQQGVPPPRDPTVVLVPYTDISEEINATNDIIEIVDSDTEDQISVAPEPVAHSTPEPVAPEPVTRVAPAPVAGTSVVTSRRAASVQDNIISVDSDSEDETPANRRNQARSVRPSSERKVNKNSKAIVRKAKTSANNQNQARSVRPSSPANNRNQARSARPSSPANNQNQARSVHPSSSPKVNQNDPDSDIDEDIKKMFLQDLFHVDFSR